MGMEEAGEERWMKGMGDRSESQMCQWMVLDRRGGGGRAPQVPVIRKNSPSAATSATDVKPQLQQNRRRCHSAAWLAQLRS